MYSEARERTFFSRVFFNMAWALALTAIAAYAVASYPPFVMAVTTNVTGLVILMLLEVLLVFVLSRRIATMSVGAAYLGLVVFSLVNGVTLSLIFLVYSLTSIAAVFFASAALFLAMGLFGYFTKVDLSPLGRFLIMLVFGLIIAAVVNLFIQSTALVYAYSFVGVLVFSGLTAYDVQYLKRMHESAAMSPEMSEKVAIIGALKLYLDLINLFLSLLRLFGRRR